MGLEDKIENAAEKLGGKGTGSGREGKRPSDVEAKGKADQCKADLKQAGEKVKDAFKRDRPPTLEAAKEAGDPNRGGPSACC